MDSRAGSTETNSHHGVFLLAEEKFDFDVPLSPDSSAGDEDEVFVGSIPFCESPRLLEADTGWNPPSAEELEFVCQETSRLVKQLQSDEMSRLHKDGTADVCDDPREGFVQGAVDKRVILGQQATRVSPIKRQTFCLHDTPTKQLPSAFQRRFLKALGSAPGMATSTRSAARLSTSSPVSTSRSRPSRASLRAQAEPGICIGPTLKPAAPKTSCSTGKKKAGPDTSRQQLHAKVAPNCRPRTFAGATSSRTVSCEDLVSSDVSDASFSSSLPVRRTAAPPVKSVQRNLSAGRAAPPPSRSVMDRTSSSSSSVSSFNSSLSMSPVRKGKMNSSLNASISGSAAQVPVSVAGTTSATKARHSTLSAAGRQTSSSATAGRLSLSVQARKLSDTEHITRSTQLKRFETGTPTPLCITPPKRSMKKTTSVPSSRPKATAWTPGTLTPARQNRGTADLLKPQRMTSSVFVGSPLKQSVPIADDSLLPSAGGKKFLQVKASRPSALPTPLRGRTSNAMATPNSLVQPVSLQRSAVPASTSAKRARGCSTACTREEEDTFHLQNIQPFCLEEDHLDAPPITTLQSEQLENTESVQLEQNISDSRKTPEELPSAEGAETQEVLLLDLPALTLQPQEKLLIDLTNTPDLVHTKNACAAAQLIDLSSPLIKWSPDDKKENRADEVPLINLSF
ncbi:G2 and S phase-expressed protein 1 [Thalassophryne amazonica]|uniref:G2 and S phase-expressed protein 1 n=1 Tax=Thalassophryne amazonica TaxID=390379 RepID=UPI00147231BC|nr:G2 and S phase-expressed protein 1 [Thalassophryne amazonica]